MSSINYPANSGSVCCGRGDKGLTSEYFINSDETFIMGALDGLFAPIHNAFTLDGSMITHAGYQQCNVRVGQIILPDYSIIPNNVVDSCKDTSVPNIFQTPSCAASIFKGFGFFNNIHIPKDVCSASQLRTVLEQVKEGLRGRTLVTLLNTMFKKGLESDVYVCSGDDMIKKSYTEYVAFPAIDRSSTAGVTDGITLKFLKGLMTTYARKTKRLVKNLGIVLDQKNFDNLKASIEKDAIDRKCCDSLYEADNLLAQNGWYKVPNTCFVAIVQDDNWFERDAAGIPLLPVFDPKLFGMLIGPRYHGHSLPDEKFAKYGSNYIALPLMNGVSIDLFTVQDTITLTPGVFMAMSGSVTPVRLRSDGQFYIKGQPTT